MCIVHLSGNTFGKKVELKRGQCRNVEKEPLESFELLFFFSTFGTGVVMVIMLEERLVWGLDEGMRRLRC